jgi:hypothetical protein
MAIKRQATCVDKNIEYKYYMSMSGDAGKQEFNRQEVLIFPLGRNAVDKALKEIAQNPKNEMIKEEAYMEHYDPELLAFLEGFQNSTEVKGFDFMEGACWTYKILRIQADTCNKKLPQVSFDLLETHSRDGIQNQNERTIKQLEPLAIEEKMEKIATQDVEFERAIKEFTKYKVFPTVFNFGATEVYSLMKKSLETKELERKFSI